MKIEKHQMNRKKKKKNERKIKWTQKQLYEQFIRQKIGKVSEDRWG